MRDAQPVRLLRRPLLPIFVGLLTTACADVYPQTTLEPLSDYGWMLQDLFVLILIMAAVVFVAVEGALLYAALRFRGRPGDPRPEQVHGNTRLEIAWTIAPALVLLIIAVPTVSTIFVTQSPPPTPNPIRVRVIGHQWWWEFHYPELNIVAANELHLPVGRTVTVDLESADVIHAFWIPRLGGKRDNVPGQVNRIWFTPDTPGVYPGQCAEFCGTSHANMRAKAFVDTADQFEAWVRQQQTPASPPSGAAAEAFTRGACAACHSIAGTPAGGKVGPDLTHVGGRSTIAAGLLLNTEPNLARWLRDPPLVKPGAKMPKLPLSETDISALVAYLRSLE